MDCFVLRRLFHSEVTQLGRTTEIGEEIKGGNEAKPLKERGEREHGRDLSRPWVYQNLPGAQAAHPRELQHPWLDQEDYCLI